MIAARPFPSPSSVLDTRTAVTVLTGFSPAATDTAAVYLNGMVLPTWLERFFPMVRASWEGCRSDLATVLGDAGTRFREAGAALLDIAENYRDYDETAGQDVSATGSERSYRYQ